ncbi:hypothetical protein HK405_012925, partial [Cladochytrium tenue]
MAGRYPPLSGSSNSGSYSRLHRLDPDYDDVDSPPTGLAASAAAGPLLAAGSAVHRALVEQFARPRREPLDVPAVAVWLAFFAYVAVTAVITVLVFVRFLTSAPCYDLTM